MHRTRFPGLDDGWARLDGAAGTQMVDDAIEEMAAWMRSGHNANHGGAFEAAQRTLDAVPRAQDLGPEDAVRHLSLIHISEPTRHSLISYAVFTGRGAVSYTHLTLPTKA